MPENNLKTAGTQRTGEQEPRRHAHTRHASGRGAFRRRAPGTSCQSRRRRHDRRRREPGSGRGVDGTRHPRDQTGARLSPRGRADRTHPTPMGALGVVRWWCAAYGPSASPSGVSGSQPCASPLRSRAVTRPATAGPGPLGCVGGPLHACYGRWCPSSREAARVGVLDPGMSRRALRELLTAQYERWWNINIKRFRARSSSLNMLAARRSRNTDFATSAVKKSAL